MVSQEVWRDKLPEDKVLYFNKTRMSIDLFSKKLGIAPQVIERDLAEYGYVYFRSRHMFVNSRIQPRTIV
jgi:hypothetical protein